MITPGEKPFHRPHEARARGRTTLSVTKRPDTGLFALRGRRRKPGVGSSTDTTADDRIRSIADKRVGEHRSTSTQLALGMAALFTRWTWLVGECSTSPYVYYCGLPFLAGLLCTSLTLFLKITGQTSFKYPFIATAQTGDGSIYTIRKNLSFHNMAVTPNSDGLTRADLGSLVSTLVRPSH